MVPTSKRCRICAKLILGKKRYSIFSDESEVESISSKILNCLALDVKNSDPLPKFICKSCFDKLDKFHKFQLSSHKAEVHLYHMYFEEEKEKQKQNEDILESIDVSLFPSIPETQEYFNDCNSCSSLNFNEDGELNDVVLYDPQNDNDSISSTSEPEKYHNCESLDNPEHSYSRNACGTPRKSTTAVKSSTDSSIAASSLIGKSHVEEESQFGEEINASFVCPSFDVSFASSHEKTNEPENRICELPHLKTSAEVSKQCDEEATALSPIYGKKNEIENCRKTPSMYDSSNREMKHLVVKGKSIPYSILKPLKSEEKKGTNEIKICKHSDHPEKDISKAVMQLNCGYCKKTFSSSMECRKHVLGCPDSNTSCFEKEDIINTNEHCYNFGIKYAQNNSTNELCNNSKINYVQNDPTEISSNLETKDAQNNSTKRQRTLFCKFCKAIFRHYNTLRYHMNKNHFEEYGNYLKMRERRKNLPTYCKPCNKNFKNTYGYQLHLKSLKHSGGHNFACEKCPKKYSSKSGLRTHIAHHHSGQNSSFFCDICGKGFAFWWKICDHMKEQHFGKIPCTTCDQVLSSKKNLAIHLKRKHGTIGAQSLDKKFLKQTRKENWERQCDVCFQNYSNFYLLKKHKFARDCPKYKCNQCSQEFLQYSVFKTHLMSHSHENMLACPKCSKVFCAKRLLKNHMKTHPIMQILYKCDECPKIFKHKNSLLTHLNVHTGRTPFHCKLCSLKFRSPTVLKWHVLTFHKGKSRYSCSECGGGLSSKKKLVEHITNEHATAVIQFTSPNITYIS